MWLPIESCMTVPEVSSMCQSATSPGWVEIACTIVVAAEVALAEPAELVPVTTTRRVRPTSALVAV